MRKTSHSQNIIRYKELILKLLDSDDIDINSGDIVVDIGAGTGKISQCLHAKVGKSGKLILIEIDKGLAERLQERFGSYSNVAVINQSVLDYTFPKKHFKTFSNIPFNYTSDILNKLLNPHGGLVEAYLIMQKEAFDMFAGQQINPKNKETLKSLQSYPFFTFDKCYKFNKSDFDPEPSVDIVLAKICRRDDYLVKKDSIDTYNNFVISVSKDRVGQGLWRDIFTKIQLNHLAQNSSLVFNRGISSQTASEILKSFNYFIEKADKAAIKVINEVAKNHLKNIENIEKVHRTR